VTGLVIGKCATADLRGVCIMHVDALVGITGVTDLLAPVRACRTEDAREPG
jgi:hypothetical protein